MPEPPTLHLFAGSNGAGKTTFARAYLRQALYALNAALGEEWWRTDRETVGLHPDADVQTDMGEFQVLVSSAPGAGEQVARLIRAASLAKAEFLAGFSLADAPCYRETKKN